MLQILAADGTLVGEPPLGLEASTDLYRAMVTARVFDHKANSLQRQGRLATYAPFEGQEAAQIGSAAALDRTDWMVATYRDAAAMWYHGYPWTLLLIGRTGDERGGSPPQDVYALPPSITVGAHMLHAVGLAWAARILGENRIALTYFGDGATSEGDFHEAMNFAAVFEVGTVFLCENNQYAISMHRSDQTRSDTIAQKADAYGLPGLQVDGNDIFAVFQATSEAVERARTEGGATLIEAVTYRMGPHTTADDPDRYRPSDEPEEWRERDPIERLRRYLHDAGAWSDDLQAEIEAEASEDIEDAVAEAESLEAADPAAMFERMFADVPGPLADQRDQASSP